MSGLPSGANGGFTPNPAMASSTLSVTTSASTPTGTYTLTLTGASGSLTRTTTVTLTVGASGRVTYDSAVSSGFQWGVAGVTTPSFIISNGTKRAAMIMVAMSENNATGITASLAVSWTTGMNADVGVITVSGADQTTPCTNGTFAANNSAPATTTSVTITSNPGDLTASVGYTEDTWVTPLTNQTLKWGVDSNVTGGDIGPGTGTTTHTWTDQYFFQTHAVSGANFRTSAAP